MVWLGNKQELAGAQTLSLTLSSYVTLDKPLGFCVPQSPICIMRIQIVLHKVSYCTLRTYNHTGAKQPSPVPLQNVSLYYKYSKIPFMKTKMIENVYVSL